MKSKIHQPGPVLDALISEVVMQLPPGSGILKYSTDLVPAFVVVRKFIEKDAEFAPTGYGSSIFKVDYSKSGYNVGFWVRPANFNHHKDEYDFPGWCGKAKAPTLPHAICLAALKALGY